MHYCKTCKWFKSYELLESNEGQCKLLSSDGGKPHHSEAGAYASDYESYRATLDVNPNIFGCLCHSDLKPELLI